MQTNIPKDPMILLSVLNTKLRDHYKDLDTLCQDLELNKAEIVAKLKEIDYEYDSDSNQFV